VCTYFDEKFLILLKVLSPYIATVLSQMREAGITAEDAKVAKGFKVSPQKPQRS
jgi:hypothetical protein